MKRGAARKSPVERRKKPRGKAQQGSAGKPALRASKASTAIQRPSRPRPQAQAQDECHHCAQSLRGSDRALFVEEEVGRVFCSEPCITAYFGPEIDRLEKEYARRSVSGDLTGEEREALAHLRFITLQEPDETWREKTLSGDHRYTLVSEFEPGNRTVWSVAICLFLRGEPSFLFIAFTTRNEAMVNAYRRGERIEREARPAKGKARRTVDTAATELDRDSERDGGGEAPAPAELGDRLADAWTDDETFLAQMSQERSSDDIRQEEYPEYQSCMEETLEAPDEVWSLEMTEPEGVLLYHFIRHYEGAPGPARSDDESSRGHWYVILARETDDDEQIQILDAFPTRDPSLVDRYRRGSQEVGGSVEQRPVSRLVH